MFQQLFLVKYTCYSCFRFQLVKISNTWYFVFIFTSLQVLTVFSPAILTRKQSLILWRWTLNYHLKPNASLQYSYARIFSYSKNIGPKLWSWQCSPFKFQNGGRGGVYRVTKPLKAAQNAWWPILLKKSINSIYFFLLIVSFWKSWFNQKIM